jgi:hypothetical protein
LAADTRAAIKSCLSQSCTLFARASRRAWSLKRPLVMTSTPSQPTRAFHTATLLHVLLAAPVSHSNRGLYSVPREDQVGAGVLDPVAEPPEEPLDTQTEGAVVETVDLRDTRARGTTQAPPAETERRRPEQGDSQQDPPGVHVDSASLSAAASHAANHSDGGVRKGLRTR